jgi:hypothetical protein
VLTLAESIIDSLAVFSRQAFFRFFYGQFLSGTAPSNVSQAQRTRALQLDAVPRGFSGHAGACGSYSGGIAASNEALF